MIYIGNIIRLQIQRHNLKREVGGKRVYEPSALMAVSDLVLSTGGAWAGADDGSFIADVHHLAHPKSKHRGVNSLSILFSSHYAAMQSRFGEHLTIGCAGENILIESAVKIPLAEIAGGLAIETHQGHVILGNVVVASPCRPFSEYALAQPSAEPAQIKATLQFLDSGIRGYYCQLASAETVTVSLGARVYALQNANSA